MSGKYPEAIGPSWFEGKQIPELIRLNDFYKSDDYMYFFYFRYSGDFGDNIWGYQCGPGQVCASSDYDANEPNFDVSEIRYLQVPISTRNRTSAFALTPS
jgi:hypothetical protein